MSAKPPGLPRGYAARVARIARLKARLADAEKQLEQFEAAYALRRPLTVPEKLLLVDAVRRGQALCCKKGLEYLRGIVPELWALKINGWGHGALGCDPTATPHARASYLANIEGLKPHRFPEVY